VVVVVVVVAVVVVVVVVVVVAAASSMLLYLLKAGSMRHSATSGYKMFVFHNTYNIYFNASIFSISIIFIYNTS
jgi:hypothetical protein